MKQAYIIFKQRDINSKFGGSVTEVTLIGTKDRNQYKTFVDPRNRNFPHWQHIVRNPEHGFVLRNLNMSKKGELLINADSQPIIECEDEDNERILATLYEVWQEQDRLAGSDRFGDLFTKGD